MGPRVGLDAVAKGKPNINTSIKARKMKWAGQVIGKEETRSSYKIFSRKTWREENGRGAGWNENIKTDLRRCGLDLTGLT